jgi:hypothetical protein
MEPKVSLLCSEEPATCPYPEPHGSSQSCVTFHNKLFFMMRSCQPLVQSPSWRTTPCWLPTTAYSIHSQLPSISGGCLLYPQSQYVPCHGLHNMGMFSLHFLRTNLLIFIKFGTKIMLLWTVSFCVVINLLYYIQLQVKCKIKIHYWQKICFWCRRFLHCLDFWNTLSLSMSGLYIFAFQLTMGKVRELEMNLSVLHGA